MTQAPGGVEPPAVLEHVRAMAHRVGSAPHPGWRPGYRGAWMMVAGSEVVGLIAYHRPPDAAGEVEIGYGVAVSRRGRGHATAGVGALVRLATGDPAVRAIVAETAVANVASQRVLDANGFARTGTRVDAEDGEFVLRRLALPGR